MRFLHCSDVHITQDYRSAPFLRLGWRRWIAMLELEIGGRAKKYKDAKETLSQIASGMERHQADHLLVTGDLTAYATEAEFQGARAALGSYADSRKRCSVIPGNHDTYTPNAVAKGRFERHFGHLLESDLPEHRREGAFPFVHLVGDEAAVVGLKSARVPPVPGLSYGRVGKAQLEGLEAILSDRKIKDRAVLVMVHHAPLAQSGKKDKLTHGLLDADALFKLLPGPRFAVLHGHIHKRYHHVASPNRPHTFGAGSSTEAGHEGYWVIEVRDGKVQGGSIHTPRPLAA